MQAFFTPSLLSGVSEQRSKQASIVQHNQRIKTEGSRRLHSSVRGGEQRGKGTRRQRLPTSGESRV